MITIDEYFSHLQPADPITADTFLTTEDLFIRINQFQAIELPVLLDYLNSHGYSQTLIAGDPHWVMQEVKDVS